MNRQFHKGIIFLNDLNLCSDKSKPLGRIDENFIQTIQKKLEFVVAYAKENEMKIVIFGDVFKKGFSFDAMSLFVSSFRDERPLIINKKENDSLRFLSMFEHFDIHDGEGTVDAIQIESELGIDEYHIEYYNKVDNTYNGLELHLGIDAKGILISDHYCDTESPFDRIEAIMCGKWESVSNEMSHKAHCKSIIRQNIKDKAHEPCFPIWTPDAGIKFIKVPCEKFVFDDFDYTERVEKRNNSEFSEMLLAASKIDFGGDDIPSLIDKLFEKNEISGDVVEELKFIHNEVSAETTYG